MRRFEYVGGGSEKFWEIDATGTTVTVRFGRLGTNGQTQVKQLGSVAEASAHEAKLVAEKVKKGYTEVAGGVPVDPAAPAPAEPVPTVVAPDVAEAGEPVVNADQVPDVVGPASVDEDAWIVPEAWRRQAAPIRGRSGTAAPVRADALDRLDALVSGRADAVKALIESPDSDPDLVDAARRHLGTGGGWLRSPRREPSPLGAAAVGMAQCAVVGWRDAEQAEVLVDSWIVEHGMPFAVEAVANFATLLPGARPYVYGMGHRVEQRLTRASPNDPRVMAGWAVFTRMRRVLAFASDEDYAVAIAALAPWRTSVRARLLLAYLAPSEREWFEDAIATRVEFTPLITCATTLAEVDATVGGWRGGYSPLESGAVSLTSLAVHVGPAVVPWFEHFFDAGVDAATRRRLLTFLAAFPTDEAFTALLDRLDQKYVEPVAAEAANRFPRRAVRLLARAASGTGAAARAAQNLLADHVAAHPGAASAHEADPEVGAAIRSARRQAAPAAPVADTAALPAILASPPWNGTKRSDLPIVDVPRGRPVATTVAWLPGERKAWSAHGSPHAPFVAPGTWEQAIESVQAGSDHRFVSTVALGPEELVRPLLAVKPRYIWNARPHLERALARFEADAAPLVWHCVLANSTEYAAVLLPLEGTEVTTQMSAWMARSKTVRPVAQQWFERHAASAARDLVPAAVGKPGTDRTAAEGALRYLDRTGHRAEVVAAAREYGAHVAEAVEAVLDADPLHVLPSRMPKLPTWLDPARITPPLLADRSATVPVSSVTHLCTMLMLCKPGETYAGIDVVRDALDRSSLARSAWSLFERWRSAGHPTKDSWVLHAQGLLGDDETVRTLSPLIKAWPGESANARAVAALDVLSAIGTDVALMHLHNIAEKAKFRGLKTKAQEKIAEVAEGLGLTAEQLADRLVPDFGLAADGFLHLDYGPRRFRAGFDEQLRPVVFDEDGSRRKALPAPNAKDDPQLAPAAYAAFSGLKKDVRTVAADQVRRIERAMVQQRRWTASEHRSLFVEHPLLCHLARRVVWVVLDGDGTTVASFRVVEDGTLADHRDETYHLPDDATIGVAHPMQLGGVWHAWADVFADYEILQPFAQLGREVGRLTDAERAATVLRRFDGVTVPTTRILGLSHRGWERGAVMDGGVSGVVFRPLADGGCIVIDLDPGIYAGAATELAEQKLSAVWVSSAPTAEWGTGQGDRPLSTLDDIAASELLRDLESLRA